MDGQSAGCRAGENRRQALTSIAARAASATTVISTCGFPKSGCGRARASASWCGSWEKAAPGPRGEDNCGQPQVIPKAKAIADAGLSQRTAYDYQELAGPRDAQAQAAGKAAAETYYAQQRRAREPATMEGLE